MIQLPSIPIQPPSTLPPLLSCYAPSTVMATADRYCSALEQNRMPQAEGFKAVSSFESYAAHVARNHRFHFFQSYYERVRGSVDNLDAEALKMLRLNFGWLARDRAFRQPS